MGWNAINGDQETSNKVAVALFGLVCNCARYIRYVRLMMDLDFTATCYSMSNQLDVEKHEVPWGVMLYITAHTLS